MAVVNEHHIAAYARSLRAKNRSERTIQSYEEALLQLEEWIDERDLLDADQADVEDYIGDLLTWASDSTAAIRYRSLRAFYNWAVEDEYLDHSPMRKMREPKISDVPPDIVDDEDLKALLADCGGKSLEDRRDLAVIRLFNEPGSPRVSEMAGILLDGLNMRANKVGFLGKGSKYREIPFGNKTGRALDRYLPLRAKHEFCDVPRLWLGAFRRGPLTPSGIAQMLRKRCARAGIKPIHPHQFRHTSNHHWKLNGGSEEDAELLFGWTPGSGMARKYGRSANISRAEKAARKMSIADRL